MTRLSDHLRGLADRAPVADSVVSVEVASRRIHRQRRMRAGANAAAGVGAAAVIAFAAINPGVGAKNTTADAAMDPAIGGGQNDSAMIAPEDATRLAWGTCGTYPLSDYVAVDPVNALTLSGAPDEAVGGDTLSLTATLVPASSGEVETFGPQALILWDGMVVASGTTEAAESAVLSLTAGEPIEQTVAADLVDCWAGAPLPGGKYQALAVQELYTAVETAPPLSTDPGVDPGMPVEPTVAPSPDSGASTSSGSATSGVAPAETGDALPPNTTVDGAVVGGGLASDAVTFTRVVSTPLDFVVAGDVPEDPFGQYQPKPVEPIATPDDLLTPAAAREGYAAHVTSTPWAMEAGSQRVLKSNDSALQNDDTAWQQNYFGCAWDASQNVSFPATSATWDLLDVSANLPSSIDVSYGWVVEGNPSIDLKVTNVSDNTLPGYWGSDPNTTLVLVRDGKVVAEGYPVPARRDSGVLLESGVLLDSGMVMTEQDGMLSPGDSLGGTYLWRDVNGCYNGTDQELVGPGIYTVLNAQSIYFDSGRVYYDAPVDGVVPEPALGAPSIQKDTATYGDTSVSSDSARSAIAPAPADYDWIELQVWTSLGTITVR